MKRIYLTVDTECHDINNQDRYIWGRTRSGKEYGLRKILDIGRDLNIPINFFVDIPESKQYGIEFIKIIVDIIHSYGQKAYIHLHPNYITGEKQQTFLWKYTKEEKRHILQETKEYCRTILSPDERMFFRAGRYGADAEMYEVLTDTFGDGIIDLSYCYNNHKMCRLTEEEAQTKNAIVRYKNCILFPNTRYVGLRLANKEFIFNLDAAETTFEEFKAIIDSNELEHITLTMHSWNFVRAFYFIKKRVWGNDHEVKKFRKMVCYAQLKGYVFSDLSKQKQALVNGQNDQLIDLCLTRWQKIKSLYYNYVRFGNTARLSPKYFRIYAIFYCILGLIVVFCIIKLLSVI